MKDEVYFIQTDDRVPIGGKPTNQRVRVFCTIDGLDERLVATLFGSIEVQCFRIHALRNMVPFKPDAIEVDGVPYKVSSYRERGNKVQVIVNE